jgi:hypothetical protein
MIEPLEDLIELPSRRRFFFFLGAAFVTATLAPGQLIEPVVYNTEIVTFPVMTLDGLNQMLKEIYLPLIREQMNSSSLFLNHFKQGELQ